MERQSGSNAQHGDHEMSALFESLWEADADVRIRVDALACTPSLGYLLANRSTRSSRPVARGLQPQSVGREHHQLYGG